MTRTKSPPFPELTFCRMSFETFRFGWASDAACVLCSKTKRGRSKSESKPPHSIGKIKRFIKYSVKLVKKFHSRLKSRSVNEEEILGQFHANLRGECRGKGV